MALTAVEKTHGWRGEIQTDGLGKLGCAVSQHMDACRVGPSAGRPFLHDEGIIDGNADHLVNTLGLELIHGANKAGHMGACTCAGIGAGQSENHNLAALTQTGNGDAFRTFSANPQQFGVGQGLTGCNGHDFVSLGVIAEC